MKTLISIALLAFLYFLPASAQQADYAKLKSEAEQFYAAGSYARANEVYARVDKTKLAPDQARWVEFRISDTYYGNYIPLDTLENALKISTTENEKAHLHFLIAMTMRYAGGDWEARQRVPEEFEAALKAGKQSDWYDDALFNYAQWMESTGSIRQLDNGEWQQEPDYVKALELFRRLTKEFAKGETRYYDQALEQIRQTTEPTLSVGVSNIFLPEAELQFALG